MGSTAAFEPLIGLRLKRLDGPAPDVLALTFEQKGQRLTLLARLRGAMPGVGVVEERPRGDDASPAITRLRHHVLGSGLVQVALGSDGALQLSLKRGERALRLKLSFSAHHGNAELVDEKTDHVITRLHREPGKHATRAVPLPVTFDALSQAGADLLSERPRNESDPRRQLVVKAVERRVRSLEKRLRSIAADKNRVELAETLRNDANSILGSLHRLRDAAGSIVVEDYSVDPPGVRLLQIGDGLSAKEQAQRWFERARKLERGAVIAAERDAITRTDLVELGAIQLHLPEASEAELPGLLAQARKLGVQGLGETGAALTQSSGRLPYHEFQSVDGHRILVGRNSRDNDNLTLHVARPRDLFLHVRGYPGSHVLVRLEREESCPPETLLDAATLAVHFSPARDEPLAEVSYTPKRHVRKPKGSPPGSVLLGQERVVILRQESGRLERVLATKLAH